MLEIEEKDLLARSLSAIRAGRVKSSRENVYEETDQELDIVWKYGTILNPF